MDLVQVERQKCLLLVKIGDYGFVRQDEEYLKQHFQVESFTFGTAKAIANIRRQAQLFFWLLRNIRKANYVLCWFSDFHAFLPMIFARLWRKSSFLIVGGYDGANIPEFNYGAHRKPLWAQIIRWNCRMAKTIFPLSHFLGEQLVKNVGKHIEPKVKPVHLGIPAAKLFAKNPSINKTNTIICVAGASDMTRIKVKGIDFFMEVAAVCADLNFVLVGIRGDAKTYVEENKSDNLEVIAYTPREQLIDLFSKAKVVCLFSRYEGFGMVMLEGMLCECVPVTIAGIGAAEITESGVGYAIAERKPELAKNAIRQVLDQYASLGPKARQVAIETFSMEKRGKAIKDEMERY